MLAFGGPRSQNEVPNRTNVREVGASANPFACADARLSLEFLDALDHGRRNIPSVDIQGELGGSLYPPGELAIRSSDESSSSTITDYLTQRRGVRDKVPELSPTLGPRAAELIERDRNERHRAGEEAGVEGRAAPDSHRRCRERRRGSVTRTRAAAVEPLRLGRRRDREVDALGWWHLGYNHVPHERDALRDLPGAEPARVAVNDRSRSWSFEIFAHAWAKGRPLS